MAIKSNETICFVISPIGEIDTPTRKHSDLVLEYLITKSIEPLGYKIIRADKISEPGIITTQIIQHIIDSDLVIADLTEKNPNVFYELALRHATRKPLIQMINKGDAIPFDVAATRIIQFDLKDLASVENAKTEIVSQVKSMDSGINEIDNPISVSIDLKFLRESGNEEKRSLADIVESISELRTMITSIDRKILPTSVTNDTYKQYEALKKLQYKMYNLNSKHKFSSDVREVFDRLFKYIHDSKISLNDQEFLTHNINKLRNLIANLPAISDFIIADENEQIIS